MKKRTPAILAFKFSMVQVIFSKLIKIRTKNIESEIRVNVSVSKDMFLKESIVTNI